MEGIKKFFKTLFKTPMIILFLFVAVFFGLPALTKDAEIDEYAVVTAIGLDKADDKVELSLLTFIPIVTQNFEEQYEVVKASGNTLAEAIDFAGLHIGREIGLSHVKMVVVSEDFFKENYPSKELDYLTRNASLALSTTIIATDAKAVDFLNTVKTFNSSTSLKADNLVDFNENYIYSTESTFETFYKGLYSPTRAELVSFISLESEEGEGISIQSTGKEGGASGEKKKILNDGEALLCVDGKEVIKLSKEDVKNINLLKGNYSTGTIIIENFTDDVFKNAKLTFDIFENELKMKVVFEGKTPVVYLNSKIYVRLSEAQQEGKLIKENVELKNISNEAITAISQKLKEYMRDGVKIMRENKADLIDLYTIIYNSNPAKMKKFLDRLEDKDDFLNYVLFKTSSQIYSY